MQVDVTNTGTVAGDEIVMLFVQYPSGSKRRTGLTANYKELKGFTRAKNITAGVTAHVVIPLRVADLKYFDGAKHGK